MMEKGGPGAEGPHLMQLGATKRNGNAQPAGEKCSIWAPAPCICACHLAFFDPILSCVPTGVQEVPHTGGLQGRQD